MALVRALQPCILLSLQITVTEKQRFRRRRFLPFGRASIASGYTQATVPGRCPGPRRRRKPHIICPAAGGRAHSFRCVSSPNETH